MTYTNTQASISLASSWSCSPAKVDGQWVWSITSKPTAASKTVEFPVSLPADAVISRAWVAMSINGSPYTGAAYKRCNGVSIPSTGVVDVEGISAETETFSAVFTFKANGAVIQDGATHSSTLTIGFPTLNVEYTSESESAPEDTTNHPGNITRDENAGNQLPRLLDSDFLERARLEPSLLSLDLQLDPLSSATMTIPAGQEEVKVRDLVELFDPNGSVGIFRVSKVETTFGQVQRVYLKHVFCTLGDDLTIGVQAISGTFREVISSILEAQTTKNWVLGDVELPDEYELVYAYSYVTLLEAISDLFDRLPEGYAWEFDTLQRPWVMHLRALTDADYCECRENRNLTRARVTVDSSNLCTRIYPYGAGEKMDRINLSTLTGSLFIDADTKDTWGVVARTFTEEEIFDSITLQDVALRYLEKHKDPTVSVTLDALGLYELTGDPIDRFRLGRLCRLPLPAYGVVMNERVISVSFPDVYGKPETATVTLANKIRSIADELANLIREANASKIIGGTVETTEISSYYGAATTTGPHVVYFDIDDYGNLLAARVQYSCTNASTGLSASCSIAVDGNAVDMTNPSSSGYDIFPYLDRDDSGVPVVGQHWARFTPKGASDATFGVKVKITLKTIERK